MDSEEKNFKDMIERRVCFTAVDDNLYYPEGTHIFVNSFKRFHPDIDLVVFRQDTVDKLFPEKNINWFQAKPFLAELLEDKYDLIVNMDADHVVTGRMTEVFDRDDYDIGFPWNFNDYENASFENISEEMYLQAGMVASRSKQFWASWRDANAHAMDYLRKENDIVNLVVYNDPEIKKLRLKIFDKEKNYYGCKSLGREPQFYIEDDKLMCRDEQILAYHYARGGRALPKLDFKNMPLTDEVKNWLYGLSYGQTIKITNI